MSEALITTAIHEIQKIQDMNKARILSHRQQSSCEKPFLSKSMDESGSFSSIRSKETIVDFSRHSTTHGIYYICEEGATKISRIFWSSVCLFLACVSIYMILQSYWDWEVNPVRTTINTTSMPIEEIEFPGITICGLGAIKVMQEAAYLQQAAEYLTNKGITVDNLEHFKNVEELLSTLMPNNSFLDEYYPGSIVRPTEIAEYMASQNPDKSLEANGIVTGGEFDSCSYGREDQDNSNELGLDVPNGSNGCTFGVQDPVTLKCIDMRPKRRAFVHAMKDCITKNGYLFQIYDDNDLAGLENAFESGVFTMLPEDSEFWINVQKEASGTFTTNNFTTLSNDSFSSLKTGSVKNNQDQCMTLSFNPRDKSKRFTARTRNCSEERPYLCYSYPVNLNCSKSYESDGNYNETSYSSIKLLDTLLNPARRPKIQKAVSEKRHFLKMAFNSIDLRKAYTGLFELLWYAQLPCFDVNHFSKEKDQYSLLKKCIWKGISVPCSAIFKTFPTDRGMCCTFNVRDVTEMFVEDIYTDMIEKLQIRDQRDAISGGTLPDSFSVNGEPRPKNGINRGLTVILDAHTDLIEASSIDQDFKGFLAVVDSRHSHPTVNANSFRIRPGHDNLVAISPTKISAFDTLSSMAVSERKCYNRDEPAAKGLLLYHGFYSQSSCILECQMQWAISRMDKPCIPWYLPSSNSTNTTMCDPWEAFEFRHHMNQVDDNFCSHCLPDCQIDSFKTTVTTVPFRSCDNRNLGISMLCNLEEYFFKNNLPQPPIFGKQLLEEYEYDFSDRDHAIPQFLKNVKGSQRRRYSDPSKEVFPESSDKKLLYDAYKEDIAVVHFFFDTPIAIQYTRAPWMTWVDFLSKVGGLLGLCLGFSFASGIEVFYWFGTRLCCHGFCKQRFPAEPAEVTGISLCSTPTTTTTITTQSK